MPLRPMTDKIKESLFNVLSPYFFEGCKVLDLFSGTGNLAFEALSRGAGEAHAIEKHPLCIELIQRNLERLKPHSFILHKKNVFSVLKRSQKDLAPSLLKKHNFPIFDFVLADPPFHLQTGDLIIKLLSNSRLIDKKSLIVIETSNKEELKGLGFKLFSKKDFKDKRLWFYKSQ